MTTALPFRIFASAALLGVAACASGNGAAFNAQSAAQPQQGAHDPQSSLQAGGVDSLAGSHGRGALGGASHGSGGKAIYVSGNVLLPGRGGGLSRTVSSTTSISAGLASAKASLTGGSATAKVSAGGLKLALNSDPLGGQAAKFKAGGASVSVGDPLAGLGKGKPVLGGKGSASGVLSGAGKTAGSLIGSGSKGADGGVNLLIGSLAGGKHKKPLGL